MENDKVLNTEPNPHFTVNKRIAYHLAGHSASIYLGNKQKQLPAVHFQIIVKLKEQDLQQSDLYRRIVGRYTAIIEGGRLIQNLPMSFSEATRYFSSVQFEAYRCAYEADVINLLAGPSRGKICSLG